MNYHIDVLPGDMDKNTPFKYDSEGVIKTKIPYTQEYHYHTTAIASCALSEDMKETGPHIRWLLDNIGKDGSYKHNFTLPFYNNFSKPWVGGLAQGLAISALVQANHIKTAKKAFEGLLNNCLYIDGQGDTWIKEYPLDEHVCILNGFIYALLGVFDFYKQTGNEEARVLWKKGIITLKHNLEKYDLGCWSRYALLNNIPSTSFYNNVHVKQLNALYDITSEQIFKRYATKWDTTSCPLKIRISRIKKIVTKNGILGCWNKYWQRRWWLNG